MELFGGICAVVLPFMYVHLWFINRRLQKRYNALWKMVKYLSEEMAEPTKEKQLVEGVNVKRVSWDEFCDTGRE